MYRIGQEEIAALTRVIETRDMFKINNGLQESRHVEESLQEIFKCEHAVFMTSGHAALVAGLVALGIGPGDEVIVPAYTYISTAMAVVSAGAMPVIAEVDETLTIDPEDVRRHITPHTKAVIPVHIQGFPCNMDAIMEIAGEYGIAVLEDACQADGGAYKGNRLGTIGNAGTLSFNYFKIVSSGEGGALLTHDKNLYERALIYHDAGAIAFFGDQMTGFETEGFCGNEYRSNELCAAVMRVQLTRLDGILADLSKNKKYLMDAIADIAQFVPSNDLEGDCGTTLALRFETEEKARAFATAPGVRGTLPIDTGRHVYTHWEPIMKKRGALHPAMDPFKMEANRDIVPDYRPEMCPATLDYLARSVYVGVDPNHSAEKLDEKIAALRAALQNL